MKKGLMVTLMLLVMGSLVFAQGSRGAGMMMKMDKMERMGDGWLNLTDDQEKAIDKMRLDMEKGTMSLRNDLESKRDDLHLLMTADNPNQKEIDKKLDEMSTLQTKLHKVMIDHKLAVRKMLNADQKVKWDQHLLKMGGGMGCGMGMGMGMGIGEGPMKIRMHRTMDND